jgi:hypothetical protein
MENTSIVNGWIAELGQEAGINDLKLNEHHVCAFRYGKDLEFIIELPPGSPIVYMYSPMVDVPQENKEAFFDKLLKANFFCLETNGATFSIDERSNRIVLSYGQPIDQIDNLIFKNIVGNFLETAEQWKERLRSFENAETPINLGKEVAEGIGFKV